MTFHAGVLVGLLVSASVALLGPIALAVFVWRRFKPWALAVAIGGGVFFVFQVVTRIPLLAVLAPTVKKVLTEHPSWTTWWLLILCFTAGLFEETGRWVAYRFMPRLRTRANGLLMGVGHGGIEAMLLVGVNVLVSAALYVWMTHGKPFHLPLPDEALQLLEKQFASLTWGLALMGGLERVWAMMVHCGLSLVVLEGYRRKQQGRWLLLAMGFHGVSNFAGVMSVKLLGPYGAEAVIGVFGLLALWWTVRWMKQGDAAPA